MVVGGASYYYADGHFLSGGYSSGSVEYVVVTPPVGAVVCELPPGSSTDNIGGVVHYVFDGIYYLAVYDGDQICYQVVEVP